MRDWKETFVAVMSRINFVLVGMLIGIALCKFWPEFWWFINWGISV